MPEPAREVEVEVLPKGDRRGSMVGGGRPGLDPLVALIARIMDTLFTIPGTRIRFGLDPLIGLIPGFGSPVSAFVSLMMIARSAQHGVPNVILARMGLNVLINGILDAVPVVGDALSIFYRSNAENYELLEKYAGTRRRATAADRLFVFGLLAAIAAIFALLIIGGLTVLRGIWRYVTS